MGRFPTTLLNLDHGRFGLAISLLVGLYKGTLCLMRRTRGTEDGWNAIVAAIVSSLSFMVEEKQRRMSFVLLLFSRSWEPLLNLAERRGIAKKPRHWYLAVFAGICVFVFYAYLYEFDVFPGGIEKFVIGATRPKPQELQMVDLDRRLGEAHFLAKYGHLARENTH